MQSPVLCRGKNPPCSDKGWGSSSAGMALGVLADSKLSMSQSCALAVMMANDILGCIKRSTVSRLREETIPITYLFFRPHLENSIQFRTPQYEKGIDKL